jgi:hypothetical protein
MYIKYYTCFLLAVVLIIGVEHVLRISKIEYKPSTALKLAANVTNSTFEFIGKKTAELSSFLTHVPRLITFIKDLIVYLKLHDLYNTLCEIIRPIIDIIMSPTWVIIGYFKETTTYNYPILVIIGSALLILMILGIIYKFCDYNKYIDQCKKLYGIFNSLNNKIYTGVLFLTFAIVAYCCYQLKNV